MVVNTLFTQNTAKYGGAVYVGANTTANFIDTNFIDNTATVNGGAIYADKNSTVNVRAVNTNVLFEGNTADGLSNAIHLNNAKLNLTAEEGRKISINDDISGKGTITTKGDVYILNKAELVKGSNITIYNDSGKITVQHENSLTGGGLALAPDTTLHIANGTIGTVDLKSITLTSTSNIVLDMDLKNGLSDKVKAETTEGNGTLNISSVNLISNSIEPVSVKVGEGSEVKTLSATKAETAEATYKLKASLDANGNLVATAYGQKAKPCTMAAPVAAQLGGYLTQINSYDQAFMNMDMNMGVNKQERDARDRANQFAYTGNNYVYTDNGINTNGKGLWTRPYVTFERVNLSNGPKVGSIAYGNFFGGDADMKYYGNGWARQFSAYVGYNGSTLDFDRQSVDQNGGTIGITEVWYKKNFFTGITANVSANAVNAQTDLGHENFPMLMAGVASKTGYNFEFKNGKFIIQPSLLLSYSFVHTFAHDNGKGSHVGSSPLHAIQVAPGVKFIANLPKGWQPYAAINMRWNIMDKTHFSLQDVAIPDMSVDPYVEYGVGLQRKWGERYMGNIQALIRNGGRNGVMLSASLKWFIGK